MKVKDYKNLIDNAIKTFNKENVFLIQVCGVIGCGKTSVVKKVRGIYKRSRALRESCDIRFVFEDVESKECVDAISGYYNKTMAADEMELTIVGHHIEKLLEAFTEEKGGYSDNRPIVIITDRSIMEDLLFIKDIEKDSDFGSSAGLDAIKLLIMTVEAMFGDKNQRVLLDVPCTVCEERIKNRGRDFEKSLRAENLGKYKLQKPTSRIKLEGWENVDFCAFSVIQRIIYAMYKSQDSAVRNAKKILPKTSVNLYGVPGIGKTYLLRKIETALSVKAGCIFFYDDSDSDHRKKKMEEFYSDRKNTGENVQVFLDEERIQQFRKRAPKHNIVFTDIGALTSEIFSKANYTTSPTNYDEVLSSMFPTELNVVLNSNISDVEKRVKKRARPGEEEGLKEDYMESLNRNIKFEIENRELCSDRSKFAKTLILDYKPNVECVEHCINEIFSELCKVLEETPLK